MTLSHEKLTWKIYFPSTCMTYKIWTLFCVSWWLLPSGTFNYEQGNNGVTLVHLQVKSALGGIDFSGKYTKIVEVVNLITHSMNAPNLVDESSVAFTGGIGSGHVTGARR